MTGACGGHPVRPTLPRAKLRAPFAVRVLRCWPVLCWRTSDGSQTTRLVAGGRGVPDGRLDLRAGARAAGEEGAARLHRAHLLAEAAAGAARRRPAARLRRRLGEAAGASRVQVSRSRQSPLLAPAAPGIDPVTRPVPVLSVLRGSVRPPPSIPWPSRC